MIGRNISSTSSFPSYLISATLAERTGRDSFVPMPSSPAELTNIRKLGPTGPCIKPLPSLQLQVTMLGTGTSTHTFQKPGGSLIRGSALQSLMEAVETGRAARPRRPSAAHPVIGLRNRESRIGNSFVLGNQACDLNSYPTANRNPPKTATKKV